MYLFAQLAAYLFLMFLLGVAVGYALWRAWGEREIVEKYNAAEMRLAAHLARWEKSHAAPNVVAPFPPASESPDSDGKRLAR
jgi:hypothetical protein